MYILHRYTCVISCISIYILYLIPSGFHVFLGKDVIQSPENKTPPEAKNKNCIPLKTNIDIAPEN